MHRDMEQKWNNFGETSPGFLLALIWKFRRPLIKHFFKDKLIEAEFYREDTGNF